MSDVAGWGGGGGGVVADKLKFDLFLRHKI